MDVLQQFQEGSGDLSPELNKLINDSLQVLQEAFTMFQ